VATEEQLCDEQRIRMHPEVEPANEPRNLLRRNAEIDRGGRGRPGVASKIVARGEVLVAAAGIAAGDPARHLGERFECRRVTFRVQQERRLVGPHLEGPLFEDAAGIRPLRHFMPCDPVRALAAEDGPARDVQAGEVRQRPVVEVDGAPADVAQGFGRHDGQVRDARQMVEVERLQD
jgi:hypothetical protein